MRTPRILAVLLGVLVMTNCDDQDPTSPAPRRPGVMTREVIAPAGGINVSSPSDINRAGVIVGSLQLQPDGSSPECPDCYGAYEPAIDVGGMGHYLGSLGDPWSTNSYGSGINNRGQVVGFGEDYAAADFFSFVWTPDSPNGTTGTFQRLAQPPRGEALARKINDAGQIAGSSRDGSTAVLWSGGQVVELGSPFAGGNSAAYDLNSYGQIAGGAWDANGTEHPIVWTPAAPNGIAGQFAVVCAECGGAAVAINDIGQVVLNTGYLWTPSSPNATTGTLVSLPLLPTGINNRGDVVGYFWLETPAGYTPHAALWRPTASNGTSGVFTDLTPDLGFEYYAGSQAMMLAEEIDGALKIVGQQWDYNYGLDVLWTVTDLGAPQRLVANAGPAVFVSENTSAQFYGSGTTPLSDDLRFEWSFGDGTTGTGVTTSHTYADNGQYVVRLTVTDGTGHTSTATTNASVYNLAPTASLSVNPSSVNQGSAVTLALLGAGDVPADQSSLQFAFDCGDGRGLQSYSSSATASCATVSSGSRSVRGAVRDKDGGTSEYTASLSVLNVAPTVTIVSAPVSVGAPPTVKVEFRFSDPGTLDGPWSYTINWGDGTASSPVSLTTQGSTVAAMHKYQRGHSSGGSYVITIQVRDSQGAVGQASRTVLAVK